MKTYNITFSQNGKPITLTVQAESREEALTKAKERLLAGSQNNRSLRTMKVQIHGMHCASCEVLVERKFKNIEGVEKVNVSHANGRAEITYSREPDLNELNDTIRHDGYSVSLWKDRNHSPRHVEYKNTFRDYLQMGGIFLVIAAAYYVLKQFNLVPSIGISAHMSYGVIFLIGLFAAVSTCIAVVGGLLLAAAEKYSEMHPELTGAQKFRPHIYFNAGRIVGYTGFGAAVGGLGSVLTLAPQVNGYLVVAVSFVMLILGFQLLHLFPWLRRFSPKMPKFISHKIHDLSTKDSKGAPFVLGAFTFFLPCGFTQALQLYVLARGSWQVGALTMFVFSLGTLPALFSLSAVSSFAKGAFQRNFLKFAGVLVVMLAIFNISNGLTLAGYNLNFGFSNSTAQADAPAARIVNGKQIVKMTVNRYTYTPNKFTVVAGVPVEWQIDGAGASGCGQVLVMPTLGISKYLSKDGITLIDFTPKDIGTIPFNCSMGMMTPGSAFTVVPNPGGIQPAAAARAVALTCTTDTATRFHIHPHLEIIANGRSQEIPANIGIAPTCMNAIHTHDNSGTIHIESPEQRDFTLSDFFAVWKKPFSADQILDYKVDSSYIIKVTVNGSSVDTYENTVLRDKDQVVISYEQK